MSEEQAAQDAAGRRDWVAAVLFGLLMLGLLLPWPRPSVALGDVCRLGDAGRFAVQCDLAEAAERSGHAWLRQGLRVYEDGLPLRQADRPADVRRENPGSYHTSGHTLTLVSLDRSDPRSNGREYRLRPVEHRPLGMSRGARQAAVAVSLIAFALWCLARPGRLAARALDGAIAASLAATSVQVVSVLLAAPVHVDAGYWLPNAEAAARGARPYTELAFLYTPLGLYEFALWSRIWPGSGPPPYAWYLALVVLNEAGCAALLFLILRRAGVARAFALLAATSLLSLTLWFDGGRILFEPLYLLPILGAAWLMLGAPEPRSRLAAGALAAVAFLIKQYGGVGVWGLSGFALTEPRARFKQLVWIGTGCALGMLLLSLGLLGAGLDLRRLVTGASGQHYERRYEAVWLWLFLRQCPIVFPALLTPFLPGAWSRPAVRAGVCFGLAACLPFVFRQHQYYFLIPAPWLFLLFAMGALHLANLRPRWRPALTAIAALLLLTMPLRGALAQALLFDTEPRGDQLRRGRLMTLAWPAERRTLMFADPALYHVTGYRSADEPVVGYRFLNEPGVDIFAVGLAKGEGAWVDARGMFARGADRTLRAAGSSLEEQLARHGFTKKLVLEDRYELWTKEP